MKKISVICTVLASLLLAGCGPSAYDQKMAEAKRKDAEFANAVKNINLDTADVGAKPSNYKELVEGAIKDQLKDPDSAKFYDMSPLRKEVMVEHRQFVYGYSTCVYVNAKNSYGGYTGKKLYWAFIRNNQVLRLNDTEGPYGQMIFVGRPINCS